MEGGGLKQDTANFVCYTYDHGMKLHGKKNMLDLLKGIALPNMIKLMNVDAVGSAYILFGDCTFHKIIAAMITPMSY